MNNSNKDKALIILIICIASAGIVIGFLHPGGVVTSLVALIVLCYHLVRKDKAHLLTFSIVVLLVIGLSYIGYWFGYTQASGEIGAMMSRGFK